MGFILFIAAMAAISIMSTTPESRAAHKAKYGPRLRWLWLPTIAIWLSFFLTWPE